MIDGGLAISLLVMLAVPALAAQRSQLHTIVQGRLVDVTLPALGVGLVVGRLAAIGLDGGAAPSLRDLLILRSGVEFWPAVGAGALVLVLMARRRRVSPLHHLAEVGPYALLASASYEALCIVRDGCFGPASPVGLVPAGMTTRQLPVGLLVAAVLASLALLLHRTWGLGPVPMIVGAVAGVSLVRLVSAWWLPHLGEEMSRPQAQSAAVLFLTTMLAAGLVVRHYTRQRRNQIAFGVARATVDP